MSLRQKTAGDLFSQRESVATRFALSSLSTPSFNASSLDWQWFFRNEEQNKRNEIRSIDWRTRMKISGRDMFIKRQKYWDKDYIENLSKFMASKIYEESPLFKNFIQESKQ